MVGTLILIVLGAIGSGLTFDGNVLLQLAFWRCLLGFGLGGVYPLSAIMPSEATNHNNDDNNTTVTNTKEWRIGLSFSAQQIGVVLAPVLAWILVASQVPTPVTAFSCTPEVGYGTHSLVCGGGRRYAAVAATVSASVNPCSRPISSTSLCHCSLHSSYSAPTTTTAVSAGSTVAATV